MPDPSMHIVFDAEDFKNRPRGIVRTTVCLYKACLEADPSIKITCLARKPVRASLPSEIEIVTVKPDMNRGLWRFIFFNAYLATHAASACHFPANGLVPKIFGRTKIVTTIHDVVQLTAPHFFSSDRKKRRFETRRQNDINRSDIVFTVSEYSKREIMKHFKVRTEPVVLPNGPTLPAVNQEPVWNIKEDRHTEAYFLYNGTYDCRKCLDRLVIVFAELYKKKKVSGKLLICGEPSYYSEQFKKIMEDAVACGAVRELGYVDDDTLIDLLRNAKGLIYPSKYEGFGMPPLEAMHVGCPVITTPYTSMPEVCGDAVLYADPDDDESFSKALITLDSGTRREELIRKGRIQAAKFSWPRTAGRFLDHIIQLNTTPGFERIEDLA